MFTVKLSLVNTGFSGLEALDFCRRLGLPDPVAAHVSCTSSPYDPGACSLRIEVGEAFARSYFGPRQTQSDAVVPSTLLVKGDVVMLPNGYGVTFAQDIPAARVVELYLAVRFAAAREQVRRLESELAELHTAVEEASEVE